jgi:hypothetical protein
MFSDTIPGRKTAGLLLCTLTHSQNSGQQWSKAGMAIPMSRFFGTSLRND